ncbi:hypothetical protein SANTM175S_02098 [Streptomyces antimycoticus]
MVESRTTEAWTATKESCASLCVEGKPSLMPGHPPPRSGLETGGQFRVVGEQAA